MPKYQGRPYGDSPKTAAPWRRRQDAVQRDLERRLDRQRRVRPYRRERLAVDLDAS